MKNQEKREMIEGALGQCLNSAGLNPVARESIIDALAKQAIVIDCEVEQAYDREGSYGTQFPMTIVKKGVWVLETFQGHHGREGKALAMILPLGKKEDEA